jgi:hypothetical protein
MSGIKGAGFAVRPGGAEAWVRDADGPPPRAELPKAELFEARLTLDISKALRGRIKVAAFQRGITVAEMLRAMLEAAFPEGEDRP